MAAVLNGKVDAIILTGGMAYQDTNINDIRSMVSFIANVVVYPGEDELKALAFKWTIGIGWQNRDQGLLIATGNIFPLKNLCPVKAKPAINSAICFASTGAL